ncbi:hypothetical protein M1494_03480 [Candidatus Parvarchaeota archaeon]|nr:hypothetical protein [Candidatus Parvarchaeota archaeon]
MSIDVLSYINLSFIGVYCYFQGKAYYEILNEKKDKHKYLKSAFIGATTLFIGHCNGLLTLFH